MFFTQEDFRKIEEYLKQNSKKDTDFVDLPEEEILAEDDTIVIVHDGINRRISFSTFAKIIQKCRLDIIQRQIDDLQNQINSLIEGGVALSNTFGDNPNIGISQKALTEAVNAIWNKMESITGESLHGISLTVNPTYFIDGEGGVLHISANSMDMSSIFEKLSFYWNYEQEPFLSYEDIAGIDDVSVEIPDEKVINNKVIITCKAQILGQPYMEQKTVTRYSSFFLGSGATYEDMMINGSFNPVYSKPIARHMRAAYDVQVAEGDHIIIVMGESLRPGFIRADINGIEIPFTERTVTVNDTVYAVLTSVDTYSEGTINVDING